MPTPVMNFRLEAPLAERLREYARTRGRTMTDVLRDALKRELAELDSDTDRQEPNPKE